MDVLQLASELEAIIDRTPGRYRDVERYREGMRALTQRIEAEGGKHDACGALANIRLCGLRATSTMGLMAATRNWISQVRAKRAVGA